MGLFRKGFEPKTNDELAADTRRRAKQWEAEKAADRRAAKEHNPHLRANKDIKRGK